MSSYSISPTWLNRSIDILLLGCGGTGSEMIDELYRINTLLVALGGQGLNVSAYDGDSVSQANCGRQRFWPCDTGYPKAEVLISRLNSFGGVDWQYSNENYDPKELEDTSSFSADIVITCVDSASLRAQIGIAASKINDEDREVLWLDCGNGSSSGNVILGHLFGDSAKTTLPNVFDLYPMLNQMKDNDEPSCSTQEALSRQDYGINRSIAREAANLLWRLLRHGKLDHHGSFVDIANGSVSPLRIDSKVWATFAQ